MVEYIRAKRGIASDDGSRVDERFCEDAVVNQDLLLLICREESRIIRISSEASGNASRRAHSL